MIAGTNESRPCPTTAGRFALRLSILPQKLQTTHTPSPFLFRADFAAAKKPIAITILTERMWIYSSLSCMRTYAAALSNRFLSYSLELPLFNIKHNLHPFLCFISYREMPSNIWMAASLSEKPLCIVLHKCNLKAHHLFIKLLTSKPCHKRRHFNTIPLCLCYANTHAKRRRLTKGGELDVHLTGHE